MLRRDLCDRLNKWMEREVITEIFLVVGKVETNEPERRRLRMRAKGSDTEDNRPARVSAEELETAIARLWKIADANSDECDQSDQTD